jgi:hypothetical protein
MIHRSHPKRRAVHRAARTRCQAVGTAGFRLIGDRILDMSPQGVLVAADSGCQLGDEVIVSFQAPGQDGLWMDAETEVARVIGGWRDGDPGYAVGLDFKYFERIDRNELLSRLAGTPPPLPQRRIRSARERGMYAREVNHGIIPLTRRKAVVVPPLPLGVFR